MSCSLFEVNQSSTTSVIFCSVRLPKPNQQTHFLTINDFLLLSMSVRKLLYTEQQSSAEPILGFAYEKFFFNGYYFIL